MESTGSSKSQDSFVVLNAEDEAEIKTDSYLTPSFLNKKLDQLNCIDRISASQPNCLNFGQLGAVNNGVNGEVNKPQSESMPIMKSFPGFDAKIISEDQQPISSPNEAKSSIDDNFSYLNPVNEEPIGSSVSKSDLNSGTQSEDLLLNLDDDDDTVQSLEWMEEAQLLQVLECLTAVRKENENLTSVLQSNNSIMKKNMDTVAKVKEELKQSREAFDQLKEDSDRTIEQLKSENTSLEEKYREVAQNQCNHGISYDKLDVNHELELQHLTTQVCEKERELTSLNNHLNQYKQQLDSQQDDVKMVTDLSTQLEYFMHKAKVEEEGRKAAANERAELELVCQKLVQEKNLLQEKLEKGEPTFQLGSSAATASAPPNQDDEDAEDIADNEDEEDSSRRKHRHGHRHHRKHRHGHIKTATEVGEQIDKTLNHFNRKLNKRIEKITRNSNWSGNSSTNNGNFTLK